MGTRRGPAASGVLRVGCSGYEYDDWAGRFYPVGLVRRERLAAYASRFDTVELNATFYGLPSAATVAAWRARVPAGFVFAVKLSGFGTHRKRLRDPETWLPRFVARVRLLGPALGPVLVQLPPRWRADPERLDAFFRVAPGDLRYAVEVRDATWLCDDVYAVLRAHGAALVIHDLIPAHPRIVTTTWTYLRFHGPDREHPYVGCYRVQSLVAAARWIHEQLVAGRDVFAYFNNDVGGAAPEDAARLRRYVRARQARAG